MSKLRPRCKTTMADIKITDLFVRDGLVAQKNAAVPQLPLEYK